MRRAIALIVFVVFFAATLARLYTLTMTGRPLGDYVSDEVWYVSAARNILYTLGLKPRPCPGAQATLFYNDTLSMILYGPLNATTLSNATAVVLPWPVGGEYNASETRCCFRYPDSEGINEYLNLEHPPLAKYILALAMLLLGDCPVYWRLAAATVFSLGAALLAAALVYKSGEIVPRGMAPVLPILLLMLWGVYLYKSSIAADAVAILEPFTGGFGMAAVAAAVLGRRRLAYILASLSLASKYTGVAYLAAVALWDRLRGSGAPSVLRRLVAYPAAVLATLYAPLAAALGLKKLYEKTVGGLEWFLESRPPGPTASTPLDWMLGRNAFTLYTSPLLLAAPNPVLLDAGLASSLYLLLAAPINPAYAALAAPLPLFMLLMTAVYAAGNHTLYSFYVAAFEPLTVYALAVAITLVSREGLKPVTRGLAAWRETSEARILSRLAGPRGAPMAVLAGLAALGYTGSGVGLFTGPVEGRLGYAALTAAALLLSATALEWRRVDPLAAAVAAAATGGLLPASQLLLTALVAFEAPRLQLLAPIAYPSIAAIPMADGVMVLGAAAAYTAARLTGIAPPPTPIEAVAALTAAAVKRARGVLPATPYLVLAALGDTGAGIAAAAVLASRGYTLPAALAAVAPRNPLAAVAALAASVYIDAVSLGASRRDTGTRMTRHLGIYSP